MLRMSGYGAYRLFLSCRLHFSSMEYDFFKMNGRSRASKESYEKRNDRLFFEKLSKKYDAETLRDFYVANLLEDKRYVTDMIDDEADANLVKYRARRQALTYNVGNDLSEMFDKHNRMEVFKVHETRYPEVLLLLLQKKISLETFVILDDYIKMSDKYDTYYHDDFIWPKLSLKVKKYKPFLKYDKPKMKALIKEKVANGQEQTPAPFSAKEASYGTPIRVME